MIRIPKNVYTITQMFGVSKIFLKDINTLIQWGWRKQKTLRILEKISM